MSYDNLTLAWNDYKEYLGPMTKEETVKREEWFREAFKKSLGTPSKKTKSKVKTKKGRFSEDLQ